MNDNQTRIYNSGVAGQTVMNNNSIIWNGKAAIVNKKNSLDGVLGDIEDSQDEQESNKTGNAIAKKESKRNAANSTLVVAKVVRVFAADTNNAVLEQEVDFEFSDLFFAKDVTAKDRWQLVHDRANTHILALTAGGYGITALMLTAQQGNIDAFALLEGTPEAAKATTKAATIDIKKEIKDLTTFKRDLIDLHSQFALNQATYYNSVIDAFEVIDTGVRHQTLRIVYFDDVTGVRLPDVRATLVEKSLLKKSSDLGVVTFMHQEAENGNYTLLSEKAGYTSVTRNNLGSEEGKLMRLEIRMVKI